MKAETSLVTSSEFGSDETLEYDRIVVGWPRLGSEIVPGETIPGGTGLVPIAVNFTKGCYPGQELVERMDSRAAQAPRTLRRLTVPAGTASATQCSMTDKTLVRSPACQVRLPWHG